MRINRLKRDLVAGKRTSGCWLFAGDVGSAEVLSHCGFDALLIDREHTAVGVETMVQQLRAIEPSEATALVRLPELTESQVKLSLDLGAQGLMIANVESADAIEDLRSFTAYPPQGRRGAHFTVSRAARWGLDADSYAHLVGEEMLTVAMIESATGVAAIPDMAKVGGVDMFFIGPLDLSASVDAMGRYDDPAFVEILDEAERRIGESGAWLGGAAMPGHDLARLFARDYRFVSYTSDVGILRDTGLALAQAATQAATLASGGL